MSKVSATLHSLSVVKPRLEELIANTLISKISEIRDNLEIFLKNRSGVNEVVMLNKGTLKTVTITLDTDIQFESEIGRTYQVQVRLTVYSGDRIFTYDIQERLENLIVYGMGMGFKLEKFNQKAGESLMESINIDDFIQEINKCLT